jgi:hypothetical protein
MCRTPPPLHKVALPELIPLANHRRPHRPVFMRPLRPGELVSRIDPHSKPHKIHFSTSCKGLNSEMIPVDKDLKKKSPEPVEDLTLEYDKEDIEIEGRKPDLGEIEEDASEL